MRQYPIWVDVSNPDYRTSKSFGARSHYAQVTKVGTSSSNSEVLSHIETSVSNHSTEEDLRVFRQRVYADGDWVCTITRIMNTETRVWSDVEVELATPSMDLGQLPPPVATQPVDPILE